MSVIFTLNSERGGGGMKLKESNKILKMGGHPLMQRATN